MRTFIIKSAAAYAMLFTSLTAFGQGASWVTPSPTDVTSVVRVYIDLSHPDCQCPLLQDWAVSPPPADEQNLFMWTWQPAAPASGGNGEWTSSNPNNDMQQDPDNPAHWYKEMVPTAFYGQDPGAIYATGISFLIKRKSGAALPDGEPKSADQNVPLVPLSCVDRVCPFPQKWFQDDYVFITYDNNQEINPVLQNLGPDDAKIFYRYRVDGGPLITLQGDESDARFQLKYDGDGFFSIVMLPEEFFSIPEGSVLTQLQVFITKSPIQVPPFSTWTLTPGCD